MDEDAPLSARRAAELAEELVANVERVVHGKTEVVRKATACLVAGGHLLLELPGDRTDEIRRMIPEGLALVTVIPDYQGLPRVLDVSTASTQA